MWYLMNDKWAREYFIKTVFAIRDLKQATELMQEQGRIGRSNEIVNVREVSAVRVWLMKLKGVAAGAVRGGNRPVFRQGVLVKNLTKSGAWCEMTGFRVALVNCDR